MEFFSKKLSKLLAAAEIKINSTFMFDGIFLDYLCPPLRYPSNTVKLTVKSSGRDFVENCPRRDLAYPRRSLSSLSLQRRLWGLELRLGPAYKLFCENSLRASSTGDPFHRSQPERQRRIFTIWCELSTLLIIAHCETRIE